MRWFWIIGTALLVFYGAGTGSETQVNRANKSDRLAVSFEERWNAAVCSTDSDCERFEYMRDKLEALGRVRLQERATAESEQEDDCEERETTLQTIEECR